MTVDEIKTANGNVCKIKHGKRTAYYAYLNKTAIDRKTGQILGYEVTKKGLVRRRKYGLVHEYVFNASDVIEILPIIAEKWCR